MLLVVFVGETVVPFVDGFGVLLGVGVAVGVGVDDAGVVGFVVPPVLFPVPVPGVGVDVGVGFEEPVGVEELFGLSEVFGLVDSVPPAALPGSAVFSDFTDGVGVALGVGVGSLPCAFSAACSLMKSG